MPEYTVRGREEILRYRLDPPPDAGPVTFPTTEQQGGGGRTVVASVLFAMVTYERDQEGDQQPGPWRFSHASMHAPFDGTGARPDPLMVWADRDQVRTGDDAIHTDAAPDWLRKAAIELCPLPHMAPVLRG
jgi:hypothetical protein